MRRWVGSLGVVVGVFASTLISAEVARADCAQNERIGGECSAITTSTNGEEATVGLSTSSGGTSGQSDALVSSSGVQTWVWEPPPIRLEAELGSDECEVKVAGLCRGQAPAKSSSTTEESPPTPPTNASHLRGFRPTKPTIRVEPDAWSLPGLPLNVYAEAYRHRVRGELLGWPVEVRFTPVAYYWDYGDGSRRTVGQTGASLASLGQRQFRPTATSHGFERPGDYSINLRVDYRVEFRFEDDAFDDIDGVVSAQATSKNVEVLTVSPLLLGD